MSRTVSELAALVGGEVVGDGGIVITAASSVRDVAAGEITFADGDKHLPAVIAGPAAAVVVGHDCDASPKTMIRVTDPFTAFIAIVRALQDRGESRASGIDPRAAIDPTAEIGPDASIGPFVVVGPGAVIGARCRLDAGAFVGARVTIGDEVRLYPHAVVHDDCSLGARVTLHAGAVIGADGFGYRFKDGRHEKVPQMGRVEVGDDVEIGANSTIDRATFGVTRVGAGTKIDNLVQIGHNCHLGRHNIIVSQVGMAGSSSTGDYVVLAGQVGVVDHVHIGDGVTVAGQSAVVRDLPANAKYAYSPAMPEREAKRLAAVLPEVPEMRKTLQKLARKLGLEGEAA
jgi:UDP-3-O-[3-hydroxymyristoyl] glucosamine N-acyltransferase